MISHPIHVSNFQFPFSGGCKKVPSTNGGVHLGHRPLWLAHCVPLLAQETEEGLEAEMVEAKEHHVKVALALLR